jgi:two-component system, OmpR family, phosphate regulon sensor histidine kinase PhoR
LLPISPVNELSPLIHLIGVSDDQNAEVIDDARDRVRFGIEQLAAFEELSVRAALKFPLVVGAGVAGVLVASDQDAPRSWTESELTLMEGFAREIGRALDHSLAFQLQDQMVERLGVLDRAKNDFLSEVSRELRGPLASVMGYIELLTDASADDVTPEHRRMLHIVERNGDRLLALIDNLLTMSRMEAGTFEPKLAPVDVAGMLQRVYDGAAPDAAAGALDLALEVEADLDLIGDETQIERALQNLVSNAVKFTPGGGRVDVCARSDGDAIAIDVRDTGVGIAAEDRDELFSRFFNAKGAAHRETLGSGLGLYIVKQIVDCHDGTVSAVSHEGRGSTFTMRFPARPASTAGPAPDARDVRRVVFAPARQ